MKAKLPQKAIRLNDCNQFFYNRFAQTTTSLVDYMLEEMKSSNAGVVVH